MDKFMTGVVLGLLASVLVIISFMKIEDRSVESEFKNGARVGAIVTVFSLRMGETNLVYQDIADNAWKLWKDEANGKNNKSE